MATMSAAIAANLFIHQSNEESLLTSILDNDSHEFLTIAQWRPFKTQFAVSSAYHLVREMELVHAAI